MVDGGTKEKLYSFAMLGGRYLCVERTTLIGGKDPNGH
jgi:hypothetical protein